LPLSSYSFVRWRRLLPNFDKKDIFYQSLGIKTEDKSDDNFTRYKPKPTIHVLKPTIRQLALD
jgi:hypothetical protein